MIYTIMFGSYDKYHTLELPTVRNICIGGGEGREGEAL